MDNINIEEQPIESVLRLDVLPLETKFDTTADGFLQGSAIVTRTGVFTYQNPDGTLRYELRHPDDVYKADSLETYKLKPVTNNHPKGLVTPETATKLQVGSTGSDVRTDNGLIAIDMVITDAKTIKALKAGKREVSCGYRADTIKEEGVYNGMKYTHRQKNIVMNHVAIVQKGRAGSVARIKMDGALAPLEIGMSKENEYMSDLLKTIILDDVEYQAEPQVIEAYQARKADAEDVKVKLDTITAEKSKLQAEFDSLKEKLDAVEKELADIKAVHVDASDVATLVKSRVDLLTTAKELGADVKVDQDDVSIMKAVIALKTSTSMEGFDSTYIKARFDAAVEDIKADKKKQEDASVRKVMEVKSDSSDKPVNYVSARNAYKESLANSYKQAK